MQGYNPALGDADEAMREHQRLVTYIISEHFAHTGVAFEEMFAAGMYGMYKAYLSFDPEKSKWATYAARCISNEIRMLMRSLRSYHKAELVSFDKHINRDGEHVMTLADVIPDEPEDFTGALVDEYVQTLKPRDREILLLALNGITQHEIAEMFSMTQSYISRLLKRIVQDFNQGKYRNVEGEHCESSCSAL